MAGQMSVIVMTPNGRRQTVKVTLNTTLLQVLEQASSKHGFNPQEYDLRHHKKIMDVDNVIRFAGLPNNALLEMVPSTKTRKESEVILGIQIETGERFTGSFMPADTLWAVLNNLCSEELLKEGNPVVIYMRTEVSGSSSLQSTNLRSLGITGGRAMLRFVHRSPEALKTQANVSAPLARPVSKRKTDFEAGEKSDSRVSVEKREVDLETEAKIDSGGSLEKHGDSKCRSKENLDGVAKAGNECPPKPVAEKETPPVMEKKGKVPEEEPMDHEVMQPVEDKVGTEAVPESSQSVESKLDTMATNEEEPMDTTDSKKKDDQAILQGTQEASKVEEEIKLLPGDRSGCVFSMNQPLSSSGKSVDQDLPDDFFQVTVEDARIMFRDLKKRREELEEAPLLTSAVRRQREAHYLVMPCVIRIMFPDRTVLQGCFVGGETVQDVMSFVREYLEETSHPFHLYLAPPKVVQKPECLLYEVDGFPAILLYFAYDEDISKDEASGVNQYLQSSVLTNLTSQACANRVAQKARGLQCKSKENSVPPASSIPSTSRKSLGGEDPPRVSGPSRKPASIVSTDKVPKWFHSGK